MEAAELADHRLMPRPKSPHPRSRQPGANFIKQWRKFRGMTLEDLAEKAGMTASTISAIERRVSGYSWQSLEDMAEALDCTPADLLSGPPQAEDAAFLAEVRRLDTDDRQRALDLLKLLRRS